jgi:catechol 2,3-dioxygenase-like lactoylglutathione lyase family enzyme
MNRLGKSRIIAFAPTKNAKLAREFYEDILGLTFVSEDPFATVFDASGTMFRVVSVKSYEPLPFTILGWEVEDIRATVLELGKKGVEFERYDMGQDELGIWTSPSGARVAWFKDRDGNLLSVTQMGK